MFFVNRMAKQSVFFGTQYKRYSINKNKIINIGMVQQQYKYNLQKQIMFNEKNQMYITEKIHTMILFKKFIIDEPNIEAKHI